MATIDEIREQALERALANTSTERPTYAGTFEDQLSAITDKILNREQFSYDVNADPLYQNYKDQYIQQGKLAMKDTMGQAAALTGGYGSTYGQQVGQQAYDAYLQNLSAAIPELYGMAYDKYQAEGDDLQDQASLIGAQRDTEYNRYRDELGDWEYDQQAALELEQEDYNRRIAEEETAYSRQQQAYANLYALIKASGYVPTDEELAAAGMTRESAQAIIDEFNRQKNMEDQQFAAQMAQYNAASSGSSGSSGGGSGYSTTAPDGRSAAEVQQELRNLGYDIAVDGLWGNESQAAWNAAYGGGSSSSGNQWTRQDVTNAVNAGYSRQQIYAMLNEVTDSALKQDLLQWLRYETQ